MLLLFSLFSIFLHDEPARAARTELLCDTISGTTREYLNVRVTGEEGLRSGLALEAYWKNSPATPWMDARTLCGHAEAEPCVGEMEESQPGGRIMLRHRCGKDWAEFVFHDLIPSDGRLTCIVNGQVTSYEVWNCTGGKRK